MFVEATGRTYIYRYLKVYEDLPYWPMSLLAVPTPPLTPSVPLVDVETPAAVNELAPCHPSADGSPYGHTGSEILRGLVPKKIFPFEMIGACAVHLLPSLSMSAFISTDCKATSLFYEPKTFTEVMSGAEGNLCRPAADYEMAAHIKNQT